MEQDNQISTKRLIARIALRLVIIMAVCLFIVIFCKSIVKYILPFVLAYIVSTCMLMPVIRALTGKYKHMRKFWSIVVVIAMMIILILIIVAALYYLLGQITDLIRNWDTYLDSIDTMIINASSFIAAKTRLEERQVIDYFLVAEDKVKEWVTEDLPGMTPELLSGFTDYVPTIGNVLLGALFFIMATYFICSDYPNIHEKLASMTPQGVKPYFKQIREAAGSATFGYLRAQIIVSGIVALVAYIVFLIIGQSYAVLYALLIWIIDFIPMIGSSVLLVPWICILLITGNLTKAVIFAILTFTLFLLRRILEPKIVGDQTGLHPLLSLISLFIGIKVGGIIGMLIAPIVCMAIISLYNVGFFTPTINDIKLIFSRAAEYTGMIAADEEAKEEVTKDEGKNS